MVYPPIQLAIVGSSVAFKCLSSGRNVWWYFQHLDRNLESYDFLLKRNKINQKHGGKYYCYGQYHNSKSHFIAVAILTVTSNNIIFIITTFDMSKLIEYYFKHMHT